MSKSINELSPAAPGIDTEYDPIQIRCDARQLPVPPVTERPEHYRDTLLPFQVSLTQELGLDNFKISPDGSKSLSDCFHSPVQDGITDTWNGLIGWVYEMVSPEALQEVTDGKSFGLLYFGTNPKFNQFGPDLEEPEQLTRKDVQVFIKEMNDLLDRMRDITRDTGGEVNFEAMLLSIYHSQIKQSEEQVDQNQEKLVENNQKRREAVSQRETQLAELMELSKKSRLWGKFDLGITGLGLTSAAATCSTGWGALAILFGAGVIGDELLGDPVKGTLANLVSGGDIESEEKWLERMRLGAGLVSALTLLAMGQMKQANQALSAAKGVTQGLQGYNQYNTNLQNADLLETSEEVTKKTEAIKKNMNKNKQLVDTINEFFQQLARIEQNKREAVQMVIRR